MMAMQSAIFSLSWGAARPQRDAPGLGMRPQANRRLVASCSAQKEVTLLDYGAGNVRSVRNALKKLGYTVKDVRRC